MTWEVIKLIGGLFNDDSISSRNRRTISNRTNTNNNTTSASNNHQQKPSSLAPASPKIPSSPIIHPVPILRTTSSSSTIRTIASSQFTTTNDDITQQLTEENELLYLQLPEDVKCILDKLRILQRSEKSIIFNQQLPNGEWQSPFATLETAMMTILLLAPTLLLANPPKTPLKDNECINTYFDTPPVSHKISSQEFYKHHKNNSRSSNISSTTFHSDFSSKSTAPSNSTTKNSSLCKVLSASSLLTYIVRTILSMHNEALITCLINREMLDYYHSLTGRVSEEAEIVLTQVHKIKSLVRCEEISSHVQNVYDKLMTHSNRLVDAIKLFINFVHKYLPIIYEEPLEIQSTSENEGQSNKKKKNTFKKNVISGLKTFKRRSAISIKSDTESITNYDNNYHNRYTTNTRLSFEVDPQRIRIRNDSVGSRSVNSVDSNRSSASMSVNYSRTKKITLPETPKARKLHLPTLSRENRKEGYLNYSVHDSPSQSIPSSPSYSIKSNSRFKEQLENSSSKPLPGILLAKGRRRLSDASAALPLRNSIYNNSNTVVAKSSISLVEPGFKSNKDILSVDASSTSRSRRSSNSSIKSYFIKHVHSLSPKGKSSTVDSTSKAYNYWPVTEDATLYSDLTSTVHTAKSSNRSLFSGKRHKLQKTNSETDLRNLKKMWTDMDNIGNGSDGKKNSTSYNLTPHVEDDENPIEHLSATDATVEGNDGNHNLREQLFRKLVTKKSSNSLNGKKKSYPSNLIKIPHVFTRSNEEGISVNSEVVQNMEDVKSLKGLEVYKDGLIVEMVHGSPQILAGTLDKLLSRLVDEDEKDDEFIDCFLLNHIFFISSESLLQEMINRYRALNSQNSEESDFQQRTLHKNIISILYRWVTIQPQDFQIDATLRDSMRTFLTEEVTEEKFQSEANRIKAILEFQYLISTDRIITQKNGPMNESAAASGNNTNSDANSNNVARPILSDSSPLLEFESKNIAKYLTLIDFAVLKSITFFDITVWWRKRKASESGGSDAVLGGDNQQSSLIESHLDAFTRRSNMISHWVAHEICSLKSVRARRTILHKFIETARYCREYNNFHIASCIALALNSRPVQRLVKTWESLSNQDIITSQSIEELIDPSRNMRKYRKSLANAKPPVVPFFAIFLKDLTFIIEGNPTYLRNKSLIQPPSTPSTPTYPESGESSIPTTPSFSPSSLNLQQLSSSTQIPSPSLLQSISITQEPLINFEKFRFLTKNIYGIKRYTSESYSFTNQLSRPPKILTSKFSKISLFSDQNDLINSLINNNLNGNGSIGGSSNNSGNKPTPLDHIGEVIERRMFAAAGSIFGGNVTSIAMSNGNESEAELMALSLEAEPVVNVI